MANRQSSSQESTHFRVLRLLEESPEITQREIAEKLGISLGGVNYCLRALVDRGLIKIQSFRNSKNKMGYVYLLTPSGIAKKSAMTVRFLASKMQEYERLKAEIAGLEAELQKQAKDQQSKTQKPPSRKSK